MAYSGLFLAVLLSDIGVIPHVLIIPFFLVYRFKRKSLKNFSSLHNLISIFLLKLWTFRNFPFNFHGFSGFYWIYYSWCTRFKKCSVIPPSTSATVITVVVHILLTVQWLIMWNNSSMNFFLHIFFITDLLCVAYLTLCNAVPKFSFLRD